MKDDFRRARKVLGTSGAKTDNIVAVNGCCYGQDNAPNKGDYMKLCGQRFWELISGSSALYTDIIEPLGHQAREKNEEFQAAYAKIVNQFTRQFLREFCDDDGMVNWKQLVQFNSGRSRGAGAAVVSD